MQAAARLVYSKCMFPQRDRLEGGAAGAVLDDVVRPTLDAYLSVVLEPAIGSLFRTRWRSFVPFEPAFQGRHWSDREELDCVLLDGERRRALAVEVKWSRAPVRGRQILEDLRRRTASCEGLRGCEVGHAVVARRGFSDCPRSGPGKRFIDLGREKLPRR